MEENRPDWMTGRGGPDRDTLLALQAEMLRQDNRATSWPIYEVRAKRRIYGVDPRENPTAKLCLRVFHEGREKDDTVDITSSPENAEQDPVLWHMMGDIALGNDASLDNMLVNLERDGHFSFMDGETFTVHDFIGIFGGELERYRQSDNPDEWTGEARLSGTRIRVYLHDGDDVDLVATIRPQHLLEETHTAASFLTETAAADFIRASGDTLRDAHIYVGSAQDNPEMRAVMALVARLDIPGAFDGGLIPDDAVAAGRARPAARG